MTLAGALFEHEGALRASLRATYGIRLLRGGRTEPACTLRELSDYVAHLPYGCPLWIETGGALALTHEAQLLREAIYRLEVLSFQQTDGSGRRPDRIPLPRPAGEVRAEEQQKQSRQATKAERHAARMRAATT